MLEENISSELSDTGLADFSDLIPKAKARPAKISKGKCLKKASTYYRKAAVKKKKKCMSVNGRKYLQVTYLVKD